MSVKVAEFFIDEFIYNFEIDQLFVHPEVREKAGEYLESVMQPWMEDVDDRQIATSVIQNYKQRCMVAHFQQENPFFNWFVTQFLDILKDVLTHDYDVINLFEPSHLQQNLPLYIFFKEFFARTKKCLSHEINNISFQDFKWFIEWMEEFEQNEVIEEDEDSKWVQVLQKDPPDLEEKY